MASTSAESAAAPSTAAEGHLRLVSLDGVEELFALRDVKKAAMLETMLADLGVDVESPETLQSQQVPLPSVTGVALTCIVRWCALHADEEPRSDEHRQTHRFNRNVAKKDVDLLDEQEPRAKLADVINAAYFLDMPDLIDTLVKYTANNLEGRTAEEMSAWLEIPLKKDERKTAAADDEEEEEGAKRERTDPDQPGTSQQA
uniref:Skp1-related protein n=1 Tax=Steinernema glaseri TaxID=37863 RepID=A0A1I7YG00_9BILA